MQVVFNNTGMIKDALIELNGLTVIAGENDTGKSTVGKLLFSIIKTLNYKKNDRALSPVQEIKNRIENYRSSIKNKFNDTDKSALELVIPVLEELEGDSIKLAESYGAGKDSEIKMISDTREKINAAESTLKQTYGIKGLNLESVFNEIVDIIEKQKKNPDSLEIVFMRHMSSVFRDGIANIYFLNREFSITGKDDSKTVFELTGSDNSLNIRIDNELYFNDVTFVESPVPLDMADNIRLSKTVNEVGDDLQKKVASLKMSYVPESTKDFILKITDRTSMEEPSIIVDNIKKIIGGNFYYDRNDREFIYMKGGRSFKTLSIASGIKYLGAINLLLQTKFLNNRSLLIIDEPETNVHPKWQIKFAEALVQLVKAGNYILVTSHSPYFIEALKLYADKYLEEKRISFYLSQKDKEMKTVCMDNVTYDISPIFDILSIPFEELEMVQLKDIS
jgi:predicted ATPase